LNTASISEKLRSALNVEIHFSYRITSLFVHHTIHVLSILLQMLSMKCVTKKLSVESTKAIDSQMMSP